MGCMRRWHSSVGGLTRPSGIRTPVPYSATKNLTWPSGMADEATNVVAIPVFPSINWQSNETIMLKDLVSNKLPEIQNFWKRDEFVFLLTSSPCHSWHAVYSESLSIFNIKSFVMSWNCHSPIWGRHTVQEAPSGCKAGLLRFFDLSWLITTI